MNSYFTFKKFITATVVVAMVIVTFLVYALAGLGARPVVFSAPPAFVERYAAEMNDFDPLTAANPAPKDGENANHSQSLKPTTNYSKEEALVHNVFFNNESADLLVRLFAHPEKAQRLKIALAFSAVNVEFTHDEESGFAEKRRQFWLDVEEHLPDIQNALYEALIASAEEQTANYIPYTLAWMPGQGDETVEIFAWAAKHHPDWWIRRFSLMFVAEYGGHEELTAALLHNRTHDPDYRVRKEVLDQRIRRFMAIFDGGNKA